MAAQRQSRVQLQLRVAALERDLRKRDKKLADTDEIVQMMIHSIEQKREEINDLEDKIDELEAREEERAALGCTGCMVQDIVINGHTTRHVWHVHGPNAAGVLAPPLKPYTVVNNYHPVNYQPRYGAPMPPRPQMRIDY